MNTFKRHYLISEKISKKDIIDAYIIMSMPPIDEPADRFVADEVFAKSKTSILAEIESILLRELRHLGDESQIFDIVDDLYDRYKDSLNGYNQAKKYGEEEEYEWELKNSKNELDKLSAKIFGMVLEPDQLFKGLAKTEKVLGRTFGDEDSRAYIRGEITTDELADKTGLPWNTKSLINMYKNINWNPGYGGRNWAKIAEEAHSLKTADDESFFKQLDRFVDFVHNTGSVLNKFQGYKDGWLQFILDLKQHAINVKELIPHASQDVRRLFKNPTWREFMMRHMKGAGSATSKTALMPLITKYIEMIYSEFVHGSEDETTFQNILSSINQLLDKYGKDVVLDTVMENMTPSLKRKLRKLDKHGAWQSRLFWEIDDNISDDAKNFLEELGDRVWA
jgi:hypothetical protein